MLMAYVFAVFFGIPEIGLIVHFSLVAYKLWGAWG